MKSHISIQFAELLPLVFVRSFPMYKSLIVNGIYTLSTWPKEKAICSVVVVGLKNIKIEDITPDISYLAACTSVEIYRSILMQRYNLRSTDYVQIATIAQKQCVPHLNVPNLDEIWS